jgi:hypothetical protein
MSKMGGPGMDNRITTRIWPSGSADSEAPPPPQVEANKAPVDHIAAKSQQNVEKGNVAFAVMVSSTCF